MSLRPVEASLLAKELEREQPGAVVQQVASPTPTRVYLELRVPGRTVTLLVCADPKSARLSAVEKRPPNPPEPPGWQSVLRRELIGARLLDVESVEARRVLVLHFATAEQVRALVLEYGEPPGVALTTKEGRVLALSTAFRGGFRPGATWTPPDEAPVKDQPSRLASDHVQLRLAHGAEALFGAQEQERWLKARLAPVEAKLKKLARTREKVRAEAERGPQAEAHRQEGELLAQNLYRLTRGQKQVTLPEYRADGSIAERTVTLDPSRTPKQEVDWRFHQYRRLLRGVEFAKKRLGQLDDEQRRLEAELARLQQTSVDAPPAPRRAASSQDAPLAPYKEYRGHGHVIWVGRGSAHNDELTFKVARPWHMWLHARGVPGAHVVVPVEKNATISSEVLIDAAHLALHHSDLKGEPRGEVSWVPVKRVRKGRDAPPGAVTFTGEKTVMLRVEPERLASLLATERLEPR
ncbi:MAG: DUF814 domain-containing protein [Myxococcaceae bacterium]|nr:DUF814 domain-containing protein [Myxococcaceae bacterium]